MSDLVVFCLHALGGSGRQFDGVGHLLGPGIRLETIDLAGFGDAPIADGTSVAAMADRVSDRIRLSGASRWVLLGHSMGGKIASVVARRTLDGEAGLFGLRGVVLLAGSPPSPEPIDPERRREMIDWADGEALPPEAIRRFIDANVGSPLAPDAEARAVADLGRTDPEAWRAWLERGSREDWAPFVGTLDLPCRILVGTEDGELGENGQRRTNLPVYPRAALRAIDGAGHLLPLECPDEVAAELRNFRREIDAMPTATDEHARLIASDRTSRRVRSAMARRSFPPRPTGILTAQQRTTLRALAAAIVPQKGPVIDLAGFVEHQLAEGEGDGWRVADLPPDLEAYRAALDRLSGFASLAEDAAADSLAELAEGSDAAWFADLRADLVRHWLSHPATLSAIGFDGYANGGDGIRLQGYDRVGTDEREAWEPRP